MIEELTIGEVAQRAGIRPSALRYYESAGVLPPPRREHGRRRYDASVLQRLAVVAVAQEAGLTVAEIRELFHGFAAETPASARWQALAEQKLIQVEALITRAEGMKRLLEQMVGCGCLSLDECGRLLLGRAPHDDVSCRDATDAPHGER